MFGNKKKDVEDLEAPVIDTLKELDKQIDVKKGSALSKLKKDKPVENESEGFEGYNAKMFSEVPSSVFQAEVCNLLLDIRSQLVVLNTKLDE